MEQTPIYSGRLTSEQFLFQEIRIAARLCLEGKSAQEAAAQIKQENLFQYPTEREIARLARACYKRLHALDNEQLVRELAAAPVSVAKQINLYAMMRYNRLVWEFMTQVIGEKYRSQDFSFSKKDLHAFFARLQAQNDAVAAWSEGTVSKIKSVLVRALVETEYLDTIRSTVLNPVLLCEELEQGIKANGDYEALAAFNHLG